MQKNCSCRFLYGADTSEHVAHQMVKALEGREEYQAEVHFYKKNGGCTAKWTCSVYMTAHGVEFEVILFGFELLVFYFVFSKPFMSLGYNSMFLKKSLLHLLYLCLGPNTRVSDFLTLMWWVLYYLTRCVYHSSFNPEFNSFLLTSILSFWHGAQSATTCMKSTKRCLSLSDWPTRIMFPQQKAKPAASKCGTSNCPDGLPNLFCS